MKFQIKDNSKISKPFVRRGEFRGNQQVIFDSIMKNQFSRKSVKKGTGGLILNLDTGQGKSYLALGIINRLQRKTLIVTHSTAVMDDWVNKNIPSQYPDVDVGIYYGKKKTDGDIVVGLIHSLIMDKMQILVSCRPKKYKEIDPVDYFKQFGLVVFDESHKYCSKVFAKIFSRVQAPYMLGLSATPDKSDFRKLSYWGIGNVMEADKLPGYETTVSNFTGQVTMVKYHGPPDSTKLIISEKTDLVNYAATLNMIAEDIPRQSIIAEYVVKLMLKGLNTFVFADRRVLLEEIKELSNELYAEKMAEVEELIRKVTTVDVIMDNIMSYWNNSHTMAIMGGSASEDMEQAEKKANVIFTTYSYMDTGKSIPKMNASIFASPRKDPKQVIGRILRLGSNEDIRRQIIDVVDWRTTLKSQWYCRKKFYKEKEFDIDIEEHDYRHYK
jgi:hypothetical protein